MGATHSVATHNGSNKAKFELACFTIPPKNKTFLGLFILLAQLHLFTTYSVPFTHVHRSENLYSKGKPLQLGGTAQACDPRTWEIEVEGSRVQAQCCLRPGWKPVRNEEASKGYSTSHISKKYQLLSLSKQTFQSRSHLGPSLLLCPLLGYTFSLKKKNSYNVFW